MQGNSFKIKYLVLEFLSNILQHRAFSTVLLLYTPVKIKRKNMKHENIIAFDSFCFLFFLTSSLMCNQCPKGA